MLPLFLKILFYDVQERRSIIRKARTRIGELIGTDDLVEIGCGFGPNSEYCQGAYLGIDRYPEIIRAAERRHPEKDFLCADVQAMTFDFPTYQTVLFCAAMHEIPDYAGVLKTIMTQPISRIVICDFDPELRGWLKKWMDIFEPDSRNWWGCNPAALFPQDDWTVQKGQITQSLIYWDARKKQVD